MKLPRFCSVFFVVGSALSGGAYSTNALADVPNIGIGNGIQIQRSFYLLLEKSATKWKVLNISRSPLAISDKEKQELIVLNSNLSAVEPDYSEYATWIRGRVESGKSGPEQLTHGVYHCSSRESNDRPKYNPCDSAFAKNTMSATSTVAANVLTNVFTLGLAGALGGAMYDVSVDKEVFALALESSDAVNLVRSFNYRTEFDNADSLSKLRDFISKYRMNDPEGLVAKAEAKFSEVEYLQLAQDASLSVSDLERLIEKFQNNDPKNLIPGAKDKIAFLLAKLQKEYKSRQEQAEQRQRQEIADQQRQSIKVAADRRRMESRQSGDKVCMDKTSTIEVQKSQNINGQMYYYSGQYTTVSGSTKIVGFVESMNGANKKVQVRVSGINFFGRQDGNGEFVRKDLDSLQMSDGVKFVLNSVVWGSAYDWHDCQL